MLFMKERVIFDTFTVGAPGNLDLQIAKKLAEHLGLNHQSFYHPVADEESTFRDLEEIFEISDGLFDTVSLYQG